MTFPRIPKLFSPFSMGLGWDIICVCDHGDILRSEHPLPTAVTSCYILVMSIHKTLLIHSEENTIYNIRVITCNC